MDRDIKDYNDLFSQIIKETDLKDKDPLGYNIQETLTDGFNHNQCPYGRPELDHYCILAYKDENEDLLCMLCTIGQSISRSKVYALVF